MDMAKQLVLNIKQNNKSHVGYGLQKESEALISHILQNMARSKLPPFKNEKKSKEDSIRFREKGNQQFVSGEDIDAIESYTLSLAYADSKELMAYAHANRSAALYRKEMYKECLIDVDAALSLGYPTEKQMKLKTRRMKALDEIKRSLDNSIMMQDVLFSNTDKDLPRIINETNTETLFENIENTTNKKFPLIRNVDEDILQKESSIPNSDATDDSVNNYLNSFLTSNTITKPRYLIEEGTPVVAYGPNKEALSASNGVQIVFSEKFGRHLTATQEFKPGDIITIEDPFAFVIYQERYYTHCHHCLSRCYNLIPCSQCPIAQYCSERCRRLAWNLAHQTECSIMVLLSSMFNVDKDKIRMLTKIMRFLIIATKNGKDIEHLREDMKLAESNPDCRTAGFTEVGVMDSTSARSALSLATNMTTRPLIGISAFACISALTAILLATQTRFFNKTYQVEQLQDITKFPDIVFCGSVMLRACVIMSSNCFSVQQEFGIKSGSGLYVLHSLYNHSCAPNTFRHFEGLTMITRALETIRPGDQIFACYGVDYAYMSRSDRKKKLLEEYFFDCECPACTLDWPTYSEILQNHIGSISKNKQLVQRLKPFKQRLLANKYDIHAVREVLEVLTGEVIKPCEEIVHATQFLKSYYLDS